MNGWVLAAIVLVLGGLVPCLLVPLRGSAMEGLVALELGGVISTLVFLLLAEGFQRQPFVDLALVLAVLSFVGSLAFVRYMEREI
jgi:multisubunit Na+/H+ antiporter MnhF subunit